MGDLGQFHDPLGYAFSSDFRDAVFRDYDVDIPPCGGHPGPFTEMGNDARHLTILGCGWNDDNGEPPLGHGRAPDEIHLIPDAGVEKKPFGVRTDLAGEVDFKGRTNGDKIIIFCDDIGVVYKFRRPEIEHGVVIDEVIQFSGSHAQGGHGPVLEIVLFFVGHGLVIQ